MSKHPFTKDQILFEDNHILVVNKAVGQIVQGDKTGDEPLVDAVKNYLKEKYQKQGNVFLGLVHRLDRPTSGIVIMAKTDKALGRLSKQFRERAIQKSYETIVEGKFAQEEMILENFLAKNEKQNKSYVCGEKQLNAKLAKLKVTCLKIGTNFSLLEIDLYTGRHHQIRAQLSHLGFPVKGDLKYGAKRSNPNAGISLHARKVGFEHPTTKQKIEIVAPYPDGDIWEKFV